MILLEVWLFLTLGCSSTSSDSGIRSESVVLEEHQEQQHKKVADSDFDQNFLKKIDEDEEDYQILADMADSRVNPFARNDKGRSAFSTAVAFNRLDLASNMLEHVPQGVIIENGSYLYDPFFYTYSQIKDLSYDNKTILEICNKLLTFYKDFYYLKESNKHPFICLLELEDQVDSNLLNSLSERTPFNDLKKAKNIDIAAAYLKRGQYLLREMNIKYSDLQDNYNNEIEFFVSRVKEFMKISLTEEITNTINVEDLFPILFFILITKDEASFISFVNKFGVITSKDNDRIKKEIDNKKDIEAFWSSSIFCKNAFDKIKGRRTWKNVVFDKITYDIEDDGIWNVLIGRNEAVEGGKFTKAGREQPLTPKQYLDFIEQDKIKEFSFTDDQVIRAYIIILNKCSTFNLNLDNAITIFLDKYCGKIEFIDKYIYKIDELVRENMRAIANRIRESESSASRRRNSSEPESSTEISKNRGLLNRLIGRNSRERVLSNGDLQRYYIDHKYDGILELLNH